MVLYLLPGLAILELCWRDSELALAERLSLALGIGIALPPLLLELAHLVHLPWNSGAMVVYLCVALLVIGVSLLRKRNQIAFQWLPSAYGIVLLGLVVLILILRLYAVRDLPVGLWGDSYHHTMMAQLIVDHQGLFTSWEPYAPLTTFTYHFGFHANVAFFHWLTGIPVTQSVIDVGQLLNVAAVVLIYALTVRLTKNSSAGLWAVLLTGLLNTQPAYYTNWGRYTQLTGQIILPVVLVCWARVWDNERFQWRSIILAALVTACLALTHYIVTIFGALFLCAYLLALFIIKPNWQTLRRIVFGAGSIAVVAVILDLPWLVNTLGGYLVRNTASFVNGTVPGDRIVNYAILPSPIPFYIQGQILFLALIGALVALARREWRVILLALWSQLLILTVVPQVVGLPGAGIVDWFTAYIALYLPIVPLAAYGLGMAQSVLERKPLRFVRAIALTVIAALSIWGATLNLGRVDRQFQLFTPADARAMEWIRANTPSDARFLVNSFPAYGGAVIAGADGGWWIPLLTGRQTNLPPLTYGSERGEVSDYAHRVNAFAETLRGRPLTDLSPVRIDLATASAVQVLRNENIRYIYIGAHQKPGPGEADQIDAAVLETSPLFRNVYALDGVEIFHIIDRNSP